MNTNSPDQSPKSIEKIANDGTSPNLSSSNSATHNIHQQLSETPKMVNFNRPTCLITEKQQSTDGIVEPASFGPKELNTHVDVIAGDAHAEPLPMASDDKLLLSNIQYSLSSINSQQSKIQTNILRLMKCTERTTPSPSVPVDGDSLRVPSYHADYLREMQQQQSSGDCQCCYHEENHLNEYDTPQLPGKLLNFIILIAIFLHYAIIVFIEPNYFE